MERRTEFNFDGYEHKREIYRYEDKTIYVDILSKGDLKCGKVVFTNTDDTLTVSGDFGNYVFCRPFIPSTDGLVSEMYWLEKLKMKSNQEFNELDKEENEKEIKELLNGGLEG